MKRRVVITGMGAVTPIGNTLDEFWNGIKEEKVGIGAITKFDTEDYKVKIFIRLIVHNSYNIFLSIFIYFNYEYLEFKINKY